MSKQFTDTARSIVEHGLINKGLMKPARVWHIDEKTGKRTLVEDNTEFYRSQENAAKEIPKRTSQRKSKVSA